MLSNKTEITEKIQNISGNKKKYSKFADIKKSLQKTSSIKKK